MKAEITELVEQFRDEVDTTVTGVTLTVLLVFVGLRLLFPEQMATEIIPSIRLTMLEQFGWLFLSLMVVFVLFALVIIVTPWGNIRIGGSDATPSYSYPAYFTMFFSAGIAAGIVFWAPAEALFHQASPPPFVDAAAGTPAAANGALSTVFFHWGLSAWSAYVAVGLPIAYYAYNKNAPLRISTLLLPFVGRERLEHPLTKLVDVLAVFATIGGVGTSVGFVSAQFLTGVQYQWGVETTKIDTIVVVVAITIIFTVSVVTGVKRGIRRLAGTNVWLFAITGALIFIVGPTAYILSGSARALFTYVVSFPSISVWPVLNGGSTDWFNEWTLFYWVWWFSWAPFAGLFLASISRGRTLRTVATTGAVASAGATLAWFAVVSGTALQLQASGATDILGIITGTTETNVVIGKAGYEVAGFPLMDALPLGDFLVFLFIALIVTWIATSGDTATLTNAILATKPGVAPGAGTRIFWGLILGAIGFGLIVFGAGNSLQAAAVLTGGPFSVIALLGILGLVVHFTRTADHQPAEESIAQESETD